MDIQEIDSWPRLVAWGLEKAGYGLIVLALLWGIREYLQARELAIRDIYQATVADVFAQNNLLVEALFEPPSCREPKD